jgi:hypothetical protein
VKRKTNGKPAVLTHFEQIPVAVVKKVAERDVLKDRKAKRAVWSKRSAKA